MTGLVQTSSEATRSWSSSPLIVIGTPSVIRPELAFSRAEHSLSYSDVTIYIFVILYLSSMLYVYRFLWFLRLGWLLMFYLYKEVYLQIFKRVSFDYTAVAGCGKVWPVNQVNQTSWIAIVTPTDRPKLVRNRPVIELFVALFVLSFCPFDISVGVGAFVIGLSQISSFFSLRIIYTGVTRLKMRPDTQMSWVI